MKPLTAGERRRYFKNLRANRSLPLVLGSFGAALPLVATVALFALVVCVATFVGHAGVSLAAIPLLGVGKLNSKNLPIRRMQRISNHEVGRPRARLGNPNTGIPEIIVQPLYDVYFVANNQAMPKLSLFSVPVGQNYNFGGVTSFVKTFDHTNLVQAGMLESSYSFMVRALTVVMGGLQGTAHPYLHPEDAWNLIMAYSTFQINRKSYFEGPLSRIPSSGGVLQSGVGSLTAPASSNNSSNGLPYAKNMYQLPGGQAINPQETFSFIIDPTQSAGGAPSSLATVAPSAGVPASGISLWVYLDGTLTRVAQ